MKILFFLGFPNPFPGAGWTRIGFFAEYFAKKGHSIDAVGVFSPKSLNKAGIKYWKGLRVLNVCPTFWVENIFSLLFNVFSSILVFPILAFILRPYLIIISVPPGEPSLGVYFASRLVGAKVLFDVRDEWEDYVIRKSNSKFYRKAYALLKTLMTKIYMRSDLVSVVTGPIAKSLNLRGVKNIKVMPNGADIGVFKPCDKRVARKKLGLNLDDFIVVFSGGVGRYYRVDVFIRALTKLDEGIRGKIKLLIVGEGEILKVMNLAKYLGLNNNVLYFGVKNDKIELAEILSVANVGLIPYDDNVLWKNAIPAKFYEYCACGIPVLATAYDDSVLAELIKKHKIGLIAPPLDEEKLAATIRLIYNDQSFKEEAGRRARMLVEKRFDRNKIAEEFLNLIRTIM